MLAFKEIYKNLGKRKNEAKMPFSFEGKSLYTENVWVEVLPTCGCTTGERNFELNAGSDFDLDFNFTKRNNKKQLNVSMTKSITVNVWKDKEKQEKLNEYKLKFSIIVTP